MPALDELLREFPESSRSRLKDAWEKLPAPAQKELESWLSHMPGTVALWRMLVGMALEQYKMAFGAKQAIAVVGPANVGKSTLYNQLIRAKADRAAVSPVPGTTRINQQADAGLFTLVDTPGADAVGEVGEVEKGHALAAAREADFLVIVFDAIQGIKRTEQELYDELTALGKPQLVVLNKVDLVRRQAEAVTERAALNLRLTPEQLIPISAKNGQNLERLLVAIAKAEPEIVAALGRALPEFRWRLAWTATTGAASTAAAIALTPLPILDVVPLLAVQSSLVLGIARIYNYQVTPKRAKELVATFGLGFLGRTLFQELSKLGGLPGWLLAAAIASSTTVVMGYAATLWFERGERLTGASLRTISKATTDYLLESLRDFGKHKPSRKGLQQRVTEALEKSPLATDRASLDREVETQPAAGEAAPAPDDGA